MASPSFVFPLRLLTTARAAIPRLLYARMHVHWPTYTSAAELSDIPPLCRARRRVVLVDNLPQAPFLVLLDELQLVVRVDEQLLDLAELDGRLDLRDGLVREARRQPVAVDGLHGLAVASIRRDVLDLLQDAQAPDHELLAARRLHRDAHEARAHFRRRRQRAHHPHRGRQPLGNAAPQREPRRRRCCGEHGCPTSSLVG
mmetsp:Transcript_1819/g.5271  ORF Transcript_1819/g.5271 Transcript_1819/m.5271 type:complete len:200 (+) Transcript_1819:1273-1872(+)